MLDKKLLTQINSYLNLVACNDLKTTFVALYWEGLITKENYKKINIMFSNKKKTVI